MSRWFRVYDDLVDDPKVQRLPGETVKALLNLWCLASQNDGLLPAAEDIAFKLRMKPAKIEHLLSVLGECGLIDSDDEGLRPHNWNARQFKSDVSNERVKQHRQRKRNVTQPVTATPPETDQIQKQKDSEADASGANAPAKPPDVRADLFGRGLQTLANITGKTPDSCRSLVGKWLKSVNDEAIHVLAAIDDAEQNRVADPVAWINRVLQPKQGNHHGRQSVHAAARDLTARVQALDEPAPELCDAAGGSPLRLLPSR